MIHVSSTGTSTELTAQKESNKKWPHFSDQSIMRALLFCMALSIIAFNMMGYRALFNESGLIFGITPFGLLIGFAEIAVLYWTSSVIRTIPTASRALIYAVIPVILGFWFLCFIGINSYLKNSTYEDFTQTQAARSRYESNQVLLTSIETQIASLQSSLTDARRERAVDNDRMTHMQREANQISDKMSQRRLGYALCDNNPDCSAAVSDFQKQSDNIQRQLDLLHLSIADKQRLISGYETDLNQLNRERNTLARENRDSMSQHAQVESSFSVKKQTYENMVISLYHVFGLEKPNDPFSVFISFISFIIYPVYLILNLYTGLSSEANRDARAVRKKTREERAQHKAAIKAEIRAQKELIAREKRSLAHQKALAQIKSGMTYRERLISAFTPANTRKEPTEKAIYSTQVAEPDTGITTSSKESAIVDKADTTAVKEKSFGGERHSVLNKSVRPEEILQKQDDAKEEPETPPVMDDEQSFSTTDRIKNFLGRFATRSRKPE